MATSTLETRPPLPPFTKETAIQKVGLAEDGWNTRDPQKVALAYTVDSRWRNRAEFPTGREEIKSGEYISQVTAIGPLGLEYISDKDDPRRESSEK